MNRQLELAKAVSTAGHRVGEALTATARDHEVGAVPKEAGRLWLMQP